MKRFALVGAAGFVAPRHMKAIADLGHNLVAAYDPNDSVGILDSYAPDAHFFTSLERFERWLNQTKDSKQPIDYVSICSPNYLHDTHIRLGLQAGADVICEKPLALNLKNLDVLARAEAESGRKIGNILQLRLHPSVIALKEAIDNGDLASDLEVELTYITPRGPWYDYSWKGDPEKSGGIATNIGVHFFDLLHHLFGRCLESAVHLNTPRRAAGSLTLERAKVRWFLSIEREDLGHIPDAQAGKAYRSFTVDGRVLDLSSSFNDLHTESYKQILAGNGFDIETVRPSIEIVSAVRDMNASGADDTAHPLVEAFKL